MADKVSPPSDQAYLQAAAIFQRLRVAKPITQHRLHYGKKTDTPLPESRDKTTLVQAYRLAYNTLKYQDLLEEIMIDSRFHTSQQITDDLLPLAMVMLCDLQDKKFLVHERPAQEGAELLQEVRNLESHLHRCKTKLAASLARYRVKQRLLSVSCVLSEPVRIKQHRARLLPLYAWVNTLNNSLEEVCEVLQGEGVCEVENMTDLKETAFCRDPLCLDTLIFARQLCTLLQQSKLTITHTLNIQDRSVCVAVNALRPLLSDHSDVLAAGSFSALTVAHIAVLAAACSGSVLVCGADHTPLQIEEMEDTLTQMDIKNVQILSEGFCGLDEWGATVQHLKVIMVLPQCSSSALNNPAHILHSEHGDCDLLQDLCQGSVPHSKIHTLATQQERLLAHALTFPKVQTVIYCTRSVYPEENEQLVKKVLQKANTHPKLLPFRVNGPVFSGDTTGKFFRIEPSQHTNGCFVARLAREADPTKEETVQDVLARAAAKGLLHGIISDQPKPSKKERGRKSRKFATATTRSTSSSSQERSDHTGAELVTGQDAGSSDILPATLKMSPLEERGEVVEDQSSEGDEEDKDEGEKKRGLKGGKGRLKRRPRKTYRTFKVTRPHPDRPRKKPADKVKLPLRNRRPGGPSRSKSRGQSAPLTPSPTPSHHSSPTTPLAGTLTPDEEPVSATATLIGKHPSPIRPAAPTLHADSKKALGQKTAMPEQGEKTFKDVAELGSPNMGKGVRPKKEAVMQEVLTPVDLILPPISSHSFSSLSSSGSSLSRQLSQASPSRLSSPSPPIERN
ncbi:putative methyltransferase NSUN7 [Diretmus argenteus]